MNPPAEPGHPPAGRLRAWRQAATHAVTAVLSQGLTPRGLAVAVAAGATCGVIPLPGVSTALCVAVAAVFRLNQAAIQLGNYGAALLQVALFVPYLQLGQWLFAAEPLPWSPHQLLRLLEESPSALFTQLGLGMVHGTLAWALTAPLLAGVGSLLLFPLFRRIPQLSRRPPP